jgi:two-component system, cell cycle sensor histidine kinase and response regulator CckA
VLVISDSGMGIPPENLDRIFEPFYSSKVMGRSGTGLGMTVVWGTIKDHSGYLDVKSSPGKGTTITVFLPAGENDQMPRMESSPQVIERGEGETILLVDDILDQRLLGNNILTTLGYRVETVASGEEAVDFLKDRSADLVLLDMILEPGMDGLDTYRRILEVRPYQKVILVSGFSETERIKKAMELGVRDFIKKPYSLGKIATTIRRELTG